MKHACVSLLCGGDAYEPGAENLGRSLRATGTEIPRLLLATADVSRATAERLAHVGSEVRRIEPIPNPAPGDQLLLERFRNT